MTITGFVLAGGQSTRMGCDKAFLRIQGQRLIEWVIQRLQPHVDRVVVIGHTKNSPRLRELHVADVLTDVRPSYGPLMGLYTGLMMSETPLNLFVPCDMPWIDGRLIERLIQACQADIQVVASEHPREGIQPFPLVCHLNVCRTIGALLDQGKRSLHDLLRHSSTTLVQINEPELWRAFTNVNTADDYAKLRVKRVEP